MNITQVTKHLFFFGRQVELQEHNKEVSLTKDVEFGAKIAVYFCARIVDLRYHYQSIEPHNNISIMSRLRC